jgi:hypothetical protein
MCVKKAGVQDLEEHMGEVVDIVTRGVADANVDVRKCTTAMFATLAAACPEAAASLHSSLPSDEQRRTLTVKPEVKAKATTRVSLREYTCRRNFLRGLQNGGAVPT